MGGQRAKISWAAARRTHARTRIVRAPRACVRACHGDALAAAGLHEFIGRTLGRDAAPGSAATLFTRPPHRPLMSLAPDGGLAAALRAVVAFAVEARWEALEWGSPGRRAGLTRMLALVHAALRAGAWGSVM